MWQVLLSFENQDLLGLDDDSRRQVAAAVQGHIGKPYEDKIGRFEPALFRSMLTDQKI